MTDAVRRPGSGPGTARAAVLAAGLLLAGCSGFEGHEGATSIRDLFKGPSPRQAAEGAVDPYNADQRMRGTTILGNLPFAGDPIYIQLFVDNAADKDAGVRVAAIRALANHGGPEHVPLFVKALRDPDTMVRVEGARALQRIHNPVAVEPLIQAIDESKEPETDARAEAADALGQYPENRVVAALIKALADPSLAVNYSALNSLRTLTGQDFGFDRVAWRGWVDTATEPFLARSAYVYPVFRRDRSWVEYIPLVSQPPNEVEGSSPAGMPPMVPK